MALPPIARVNTYLQNDKNLFIDPISKLFILSELVFGFFRLPIISNRKLFSFFVPMFYTVFVNVLVLYLIFIFSLSHSINNIIVIFICQYIVCGLFNMLCCKRLQMYYNTLNKFDGHVRCRPRSFCRSSVHNLVQTIVTIFLFLVLFIVPKQFDMAKDTPIHFLVLHIAFTFEVDYYGHLLSILTPRLRLINYCVQSSLSNSKLESSSFLNQFESLRRSELQPELGHFHMRKMMDLYLIIVEAYDFLIDAIKWQLLVIIISSFLSILGFSYMFALSVIKGGLDLLGLVEIILYRMVLSVLIMLPLFAPCTFGGRVQHQVRRLRELLASKLYENKLDKSSRGIARALLTFTETRDLSFRLLRMLNIDISLPFKFVGLLVTYLIILLQFEKVINP